MGRSPCCDKQGLKKGPWTPEEDQKLLAYIEEHGHGNWRALPPKAGLQRCGKSCRLRWTNYLRPDIKRGKFSLQEEQTIIQLHALLGNRWSAIATHLPKRTDNEIKNYWNTHLKKRLAKMGIDPVTHKPKNDALLSTVDGGHQSKSAAKLSHMAQWESARLEAEARLARQSKLRSNSTSLAAHQLLVTSPSPSGSDHHHPLLAPGSGLKAWHNIWPNTSATNTTNVDQESIGIVGGVGLHGPEGGAHGVGSPTSTLSFSENGPPLGHVVGPGTGSVIEFMGHGNTTTTNTNESNKSSLGSCDHLGGLLVKEEGEHANEWKRSFDNSLSFSFSNGDGDQDGDEEDNDHDPSQSFMEGFTELLLSNTTTITTTITTTTTTMTCGEKSQGKEGGTETDNDNNNNNNSNSSSGRCDYYEDNKNYWNSILNLVNSSPPHSPMF